MFTLWTMQGKSLSAGVAGLMLTANTLAGTIDLGNGARVVALSDASTTLPGNPDNPPKSEIAAATLQLDANGRFVLGTRVNVTRATGNQFATSVAVNPNNTKQIAILGNDDAVINGTSVRQNLILAVSGDGGQTFSNRVLNTGGSRGKVAFDESGNCYVAFVDRSVDPSNPSVRVFMSFDACASLSELFSFQDGNTDYSLVAARAGVQVSQFVPQNQQLFVHSVRSFDLAGGNISSQGFNNTGPNHQLATGTDGTGVLAYERSDSTSVFPSLDPSCSVFVAVDNDGANLGDYAAPVLATHSTCAGVQVKVDRGTSGTRGRIYLFYSTEVDSARKASVLRFSDDIGQTWSAPVELKDEAGNSLTAGSVDVDVTGRIVVVNGLAVTTLAAPSPNTPPPPSNVTAPNAPSNLTASGGGRSVTLSWRDNSNNETGFELQRSDNGTTFTSLRTVGANTTRFTDSGLPAAKRFFYRVRALNAPATSVGTAASGFTNVASAITRR